MKDTLLEIEEEPLWTKTGWPIWNKYLHKGLLQIGFQQSMVEECIYYSRNTIMLCYVDNTILIDPEDKLIDDVIQELQDLNYDLTDEGNLKDYLGIRIERFKDGKL